VAIDPFDANAEAQLGRLALKRKDAVTAVRSFKSVLGSNPPDRAQAHVELAERTLAAGQYAEAKRHTLEALEMAPSFERAQDLLLKIVGYGQVAARPQVKAKSGRRSRTKSGS
jgi:tetratricopeptide (TPR) repeat protein